MFFGAAVMVALMADRHHDAGLIIFPAMGGNAGALAQFRARAIGRHQQARLDDAAVGQRHVDAVGAGVEIRHRRGHEFDAFGFRAPHQHIDQMAVLDHMRERLARLDIAGKGQEHRTGGVFQFGIGDDHVEDRLRLVRDLAPTPRSPRTAGGTPPRSRSRADRGSAASPAPDRPRSPECRAPRP